MNDVITMSVELKNVSRFSFDSFEKIINETVKVLENICSDEITDYHLL